MFLKTILSRGTFIGGNQPGWRVDTGENRVEEVEKTRLRLPGTSVMFLSSSAHLRLLIAALAILMLP